MKIKVLKIKGEIVHIFLFTLIIFNFSTAICFAQNSAQKNFEIYHSFGFSGINKVDLDKLKIKEIRLYGHGHFWFKDDKYKPEPNLKKIKERAKQSFINQDSLVSLDIEMWKISSQNLIETQKTISRFIKVAKAFREEAPNIRFGFYAEFPQRNYWDPVRNVKGLSNKYNEWQLLNRSLQPVVDLVDVVMPSLYTFYKDKEGWRIYAEENLKEARKYNKPVFAYLWPQYHGSDLASAKFIDYYYWKIQLETIYKYADGVIIWTPKGIGQKWNEAAPWWQATKDFINEKELNK